MQWVQDSLLLQLPLPARVLAPAQAGVQGAGSCGCGDQQLKQSEHHWGLLSAVVLPLLDLQRCQLRQVVHVSAYLWLAGQTALTLTCMWLIPLVKKVSIVSMSSGSW